MEEYVSDAVVLAKESRNEQDGRYALFTERFGRVVAKARGSRRVTSKLAGHLEPGTVTRVRFIDKGSAQIVDALKSSRIDVAPCDLDLLDDLLPEMQADPELWADLTKKQFSWNGILRTLGWDPHRAVCLLCRRSATWFFIPRQEFLCDACVSKMGEKKVSYIRVNA